MVPTFQTGQYLIVDELTYHLESPQRGDVIVFKYPLDPSQYFIKRIIGLPGDTIDVNGGIVKINGAVLNEPYIAQAPLYNGEWTVPDGALFVLGDNRNDSRDSHQWGLLPMDHIIGKSEVIYWPPSDWQVINHTEETFASQ